ncbi:MAG: outer membrane beta-barrel protein [Chitinophagaceae bacterium]
MRYYILLTVCSFGLMSVNSTAQTQKPEFSFTVAAGPSSLDYKLNNGKAEGKTGFHGGVGLSLPLNRLWSLVTGLEMGSYFTVASLNDGTMFRSNRVDDEGQGFEYRTQVNGHREKQSFYTVNVPVMIRFIAAASKPVQVYGLAGLKIGIPVKGTNKSGADQLITSGYYPELDAELTDVPSHGFGTETNWRGAGNIDFKLSYSAAAEAGIRFRMASGRSLYTGAFLDYGLNDVRRDEQEPALGGYNSTDGSHPQATSVLEMPGVTGKAKFLAFGLRIRLGLAN